MRSWKSVARQFVGSDVLRSMRQTVPSASPTKTFCAVAPMTLG